MAYVDPSLSLQEAIVATLKANAGVIAIVGDRVYDAIPSPVIKPYISLGLFQMLPEHGTCLAGGESFLTIDGWASGPQMVQIKQLGAAIALALDEATLTLAGQHLVELTLEETRYLRDPDGLTAHAVVTLHAMTDPL